MASTEKIYVSPETKQALLNEKRLGEDFDAIILRIHKEAKESRLKK